MSNFTPKVKRVDNTDNSTREQIKLAFALAKEKRFDEALSEFQAIIKKQPTAKLAYLGAGNMLLRQKRYDEALTHFRTVMRLDPLMPQAPIAAGRVYLRQNRLDQAMEEFQTALSIDPSLAQAYYGIGQVLVKQKSYDEAMEQLRQALRFDPQLIQARLLVAQVYQQQGKLEEARSELKSALNIDPTAWRTQQALGRLYLTKQEYGSAIDAFQEALKLNPGMLPVAQLGLIRALIEVNRLEEAAKILIQMPSSKVLDPRKHKIWGDIFQRQGLFKEAAEEYRAATLLAAAAGDTLDDLAELDAFLEQDEERWEDVLEPYSEAAERRISEAQTRRRDDLRERRAST